MKQLILFFWLAILCCTVVQGQRVMNGNTATIVVTNNAEVDTYAGYLRSELLKAGINERIATSGTAPLRSGILVGLADKKDFPPNLSPEAFNVQSDGRSLVITSLTAAGVRNGIFWYLRNLGFEWYTPNPAWHVTPKLSTPYKIIDTVVSPSYEFRKIWPSYTHGNATADKWYTYWLHATLQGGEDIQAGHSYDGIISRNRNAFYAHPEYLNWRLLDSDPDEKSGTIYFNTTIKRYKVYKNKTWVEQSPTYFPPNSKFNVDNEDLVQLVIRDALNRTTAATTSISLEPSDGGNWKTGSRTGNGSPSDQAFYLANRVSESLAQRYPNCKIGMYAYNQHAAPPSFSLKNNIVVLIATSYNKSPYTVDELVEQWDKKVKTIGIRTYYGVWEWDQEMPGRSFGSMVSIAAAVKRYGNLGAKYFSAQTNAGWVNRSLGQWIATQLLWNKDADPAALKNKFMTDLFKKAAPYIGRLFEQWQPYSHPVPYEGSLHDWYRLCIQGDSVEADAAVRARIRHLKMYLHFVNLYRLYTLKPDSTTKYNLLNYCYRVMKSNDNGVMASLALQRNIARGKGNCANDPWCWSSPNAIWKTPDHPIPNEQAEADFARSAAGFNPVLKTVATAWPADWQPPLKSVTATATSAGISVRGRYFVILKIGNPAGAALLIRAGLLAGSRGKPFPCTIHRYKEGLTVNSNTLVQRFEAGYNDSSENVISLSHLPPGNYILDINGSKDASKISFRGNIAFGVVAENRMPLFLLAKNTFYFYLPAASPFVVHTAAKSGISYVSSANRRVAAVKGITTVPVNSDEKGVWRCNGGTNIMWFQNFPPVICPDERFLIKPAR